MLPIIPLPVHVESPEGAAPFLLDGAVVVPLSTDGDAAGARLVALIAERLTLASGTEVRAGEPGASGQRIELVLDDAAGPASSTSPERYDLAVTAERVVVRAAGLAGLHLAASTLRQIVTTDAAGRPALAAAVVRDAPRYAWRGLSVDVVRHFFRAHEIERVVDLLADFKLNVLHLHLTDDQGWRIESPSRPELAKQGSAFEVGDGPGGYLSLTEFDVLQEYASDRFVTIVPEIDVPGHINAATHVYGDLRADGVATDEYRGTEVGFSKLTYDLPATEPFLRDVFADLAAATHGEHVHIGGDEVLEMGAEEFARFIELCERVVLDAGKKVVAWQEAAYADVRPGTLVQFWDSRRKDEPGFLRAAEKGARFIMSPGDHAYLDMMYVPGYHLGLDWAGIVELRDSYGWDPEDVIPGLPASSIEGVEAAIWTETITTLDEMVEMLLPRLPAVAEVAWTSREAKDWDGFRERVAREGTSWAARGLPFYASPQVDW